MESSIASPSPPPFFVVFSNTSGKQNLGTFLRTASAFGAKQVIVGAILVWVVAGCIIMLATLLRRQWMDAVGSERYGTHGAHRAHKYVDVVHFYKFAEAQTYLREQGCQIIGIEATENACAAHSKPFTGPCAFVIANEHGTLSPEQREICDLFVHVASHNEVHVPLDETVVVAIVLHHFTEWAQYVPRAFESTNTQGKFVLDPYPTSDASSDHSKAVTAARLAHRAALAAEADAQAATNLFVQGEEEDEE